VKDPCVHKGFEFARNLSVRGFARNLRRKTLTMRKVRKDARMSFHGGNGGVFNWLEWDILKLFLLMYKLIPRVYTHAHTHTHV